MNISHFHQSQPLFSLRLISHLWVPAPLPVLSLSEVPITLLLTGQVAGELAGFDTSRRNAVVLLVNHTNVSLRHLDRLHFTIGQRSRLGQQSEPDISETVKTDGTSADRTTEDALRDQIFKCSAPTTAV